MNSMFKLLDNESVQDAWNDIVDVAVVERLKDSYVMCLDWEDMETANAILVVLRYFMVYEDFTEFLNEVRDAGYTTT
jgi:hypothetical protein